MREAHLLHELISVSAERAGDSGALTVGASTLDYAALHAMVSGCAAGMLELGLARAVEGESCAGRRRKKPAVRRAAMPNRTDGDGAFRDVDDDPIGLTGHAERGAVRGDADLADDALVLRD